MALTPVVCVRCGYAGDPKRVHNGFGYAMWGVFFGAPALLWIAYGVASLPATFLIQIGVAIAEVKAGRSPACGKCQSREVVPRDSPRGEELMRGEVERMFGVR